MKKLLIFLAVCSLISLSGYAQSDESQVQEQLSEKSADENKVSSEQNCYLDQSAKDHVKKMISNFSYSLKTLTMKLKNSGTDKEAADALFLFASEIEKIFVEIKAYRAKYPDCSFRSLHKDIYFDTAVPLF